MPPRLPRPGSRGGCPLSTPPDALIDAPGAAVGVGSVLVVDGGVCAIVDDGAVLSGVELTPLCIDALASSLLRP